MIDLVRLLRPGQHGSTNRNVAVIDTESHINSALIEELVWTYRLLFGQDRASRKLFRRHIRQAICGEACYDRLLDQVCGMHDKKLQLAQPSLRVIITSARQESTLRSSNFRHFGTRLAILQSHMVRHRPRRLLDLYRDRRDQEKFYTFWAVIAFGTIAILIGIVQTFLSAAQLAISYKQWKQS